MKIFFFLLLLLLETQICYAIKLHNKFDVWQVFTTKRNIQTLCYIVTQPINKIDIDKDKKRYFIISKLNENQYEINISVEDKIYNGKIFLDIGGELTNLINQENLAWAKNIEEDNLLVEKMKIQDKLQIIWYISEAEKKIDEYSLQGLKEALKEIDIICK